MKAKLKFIIPVIIAIIAIIVAALCIDFTPQERVDVSSLMSTAQKYLIENQYEQAIAEFNKVIEIEPMNVDAYLGLAEAYVGMGDTDKAIEVLNKGYEITGDDRLKEMLDRLLLPVPEETTVTTTAATEETTTASTAAMVTVPDLSGLTEEEAIAACESAGLNYSVSYGYSDTVEKGYVMGQTIPVNASVAEGISVLFTVSKGTEVITTAITTTPPITTAVETTSLKIRDGMETGQCGENVYYTLDEKGNLTIYGTGNMFDYSVSSITLMAADGVISGGNRNLFDGIESRVSYFYDVSPFGGDDRIKNIVIEEGVTNVGSGTFTACYGVENISFSSTVSIIGEDAFEYCKISSITIPYTVKEIAENAFGFCNNLNKLTLETNTIKRYAFSYCESLTEVTFTNSVKRIDRCAFNGHWVNLNLEKVYIKNPNCEFSPEEGFEDEIFPESTVIYGYKGSTAEKYAEKYNRTFIALD